MASRRTKSSTGPAGSADTTTINEPGAVEVAPTVLASEDWALIDKASTFLFRIPAYAAQAKLHGYDDEEHTLGKRLVEKASGRDRALSEWIAEDAHAAVGAEFTAEQTRLLQEVDTFENTWFPRVRTILQRCIPEERQERFISIFFKDLSQQPFGPAVLDSVSTLLTRFEQLAKSDEPGAKEAHKLGVKRGLTPKKIAEVRGLIEAAREALPKKAQVGGISAAQLLKAQEEQREALKQLRRWYNDWAATFRGVFGTRILIRLGLATLKRSTPAQDEGDGEQDGEATEPEADEAEADEDEADEADEADETEDDEADEPPPAKPAKKNEKAKKGGK